MQDLLAGRIQIMIADQVTALPEVHEGNIKAFAFTGRSRLTAAPSVPTTDEAGLCSAHSRFDRSAALFGGVDHLLCPHDAIHWGAKCWPNRPAPHLRLKQCRRCIELCHWVKAFTVEAKQGPETWPRRCASHLPTWSGTLVPAHRASLI